VGQPSINPAVRGAAIGNNVRCCSASTAVVVVPAGGRCQPCFSGSFAAGVYSDVSASVCTAIRRSVDCVRVRFGSVRVGTARGGSRGCWGFINRVITAILGGFITRFITAFGSVEGRGCEGR
jgi:hypothetical protein